MLEAVCDWRSLYARHTVAKLGLIVPLRQASYFPVFDWVSTSLEYFAQSMHVLSVATQVNLPFHCGAAVGFSFRAAWHAHFGSPHLTEMVVGSHCIC